MTPPTDIIELVKELQKQDCDCRLGEPCDYCNELRSHFPVIAQSLTLACDALEDIGKHLDTRIDQPYVNELALEAQAALSKIRSLTPHE